MSKAHPPELKKFMDKKLSIKLNGGRSVTGVLRGFDPFMNLVLDESVEESKDGSRNNIGMVLVLPVWSHLISSKSDKWFLSYTPITGKCYTYVEDIREKMEKLVNIHNDNSLRDQRKQYHHGGSFR